MLLGVTVTDLPALWSPASAQPCEVGPIWVNGFTGTTPILRQYDVTGSAIRSFTSPRTYLDIAIAASGLELYGLGASPTGPQLYRIAMTSGAELGSVPVTGAPADLQVNALTLLPNGHLLAAAAESTVLYDIDPATGVTTFLPAVLPAPSSGDLVSLPDGDIVAAVIGTASVDRLVRIHPDNTTTTIGSVPRTFGLGVSGGQLYLAGADGWVRKLPTIPTAASTATLPLVDAFNTNASLFGAATHLPPACESPTPVANPDQALTTPGVAVTIAPLVNDVPGDPAAPLNQTTLRLLGAGGSPVSTVTVSGQGTFTVDAEGLVGFIPVAGFTGASVVGYRVADVVGTTAESTITVTVTAVTTTTTSSSTTTPPTTSSSTTTVPPTTSSSSTSTVPTTSTSSTILLPTTTTSSSTTTVPSGASCGTQPATIVGTTGADTILGTPGHDVIAAGAGDDTVFGLGSDDVICGGPGRDTLYGGNGDDVMDGSRGDDFLNGQNGRDQLFGSQGSDTIAGGAGGDFVSGGDGNDFLNGRDGNDHVEGNDGTDRVLGGAGNDELEGNGGADVLNALQGDAGTFADTLGGGSDRDQCFSDPGDSPNGLTGADC